MPMDFDPNLKPKHEWATYIPQRRPSFKVHSTRAAALGALSWPDYILYQWIDGRWEERIRLDGVRMPSDCEVCGSGGHNHWSIRPIFVRERGKSRIKDPFEIKLACHKCRGYMT